MAPSLKKLGAAVVYATAVKAATESYQLSEEYTADNFFEKFDFFASTYTSGDSWDSTHGYVRYRSQAEAESLGLISTSNGQVYIGPDTNSTYDPDGKGRDSVRITSKSKYNQGLMIAKFSHMPVQACGAWPAFWSFADPWLTSGEIDYYEGWNLQGHNRMAMHTNETLAGSCSLTTTEIKGTVEIDDCNQATDGQGCGVNDASGVWGSTTGATFAMEWTDSAIKIWSWLPSAVPSDITAGSPDTSSGNWGNPSLHVEQSNCDLASSFADQQLVFNIDFCGDTAGSPTFWDASCSAFADSCASYVANTPSAFAETYFMIEGIQFYEMGVAATPTSSSVAVTSSAVVATSSAASTSESLLTGTGSSLVISIGASATANDETAALAPTVLAETPTYPHSTGYVYATSTATDELGAETIVVLTVDTTICPITASEAAAASSLASASIVEAQTTPASGPAAVETNSPASETDITLTKSVESTATSTQLTTSTIYSTSSSTITSCASTAASCTVGDVTTVVVAVSTTICPVTAAEASGPTAVETNSPASETDITLTRSVESTATSTQLTTSTIYSTSSSTITSCASTAASCTVGDVTTVVVAVSTTICPVTAAEASGHANTFTIGESPTGVATPSPSNASGNSPVQATPGVSGLPSPAASGGSASGNSPVQASPSVSGAVSGSTLQATVTQSSGVTLVTASRSTFLSTLRATVTQSSGVTLITSKATKTAHVSGTEVVSTTDTDGDLMTASSEPTSEAINWGSLTETLAAATQTGTDATGTAAAATATQSSTCSGMDCIVVSNGAAQTSTAGASGIALALLAGAMFLF